jgi:D-3-phosphoglycerate dehydrogenase
LADGSQVSVSGTLIGIAQKERLVEINDFVVDLEPTDHLAFFTYEDRPGMVGTVGKILGDAQVNIAGMQVSRDTKGGQALVALSVDSAVPTEVLDEIRQAISARVVRGVDLSE